MCAAKLLGTVLQVWNTRSEIEDAIALRIGNEGVPNMVALRDLENRKFSFRRFRTAANLHVHAEGHTVYHAGLTRGNDKAMLPSRELRDFVHSLNGPDLTAELRIPRYRN